MPLNLLENIYDIIDSQTFILLNEYDNHAIPLFKEFIENNNSEDNIEILKLAQLEIDIQNFQINHNKLCFQLSGTNSQGESFEYPSLSLFSDEDFSYIIRRQKATRNSLLKLRYSHFLWLSPKKHVKFATEALIQYRKIIKELNSIVWDNTSKRDVYIFRQYIYNALPLALSTRDPQEIEKIKKIILSIVRKDRLTSEKGYILIDFIQLMLENSKIFKQVDFNNLDAVCLSFANKQTSLHSRIDILKIGDKVSIKIGKKVSTWNEGIAKSFEELTIQRENGSDLAAISFCQSALAYYKKTKNREKIKELEDRYKHLKQTTLMGKFSQEIDLTVVAQQSKKIAEGVLKQKPDFIISFLMYSEQIFPPYQYLYDEAVNKRKENNFESLFGTVLNDQFGHTSAHYIEEEEKLHLSIMQNFDFLVRTGSLMILREIIVSGVEKNKLSPLLIMNFLRKNSWLGQNIVITYSQQEENTYNWLETIMPSISDFLIQLYFYFQNPVNIPNYILAIDSLTIKIEGILRDFCEVRGVTTFFQTDDGKGRKVMREKDINALLREEVIKNTISKDDLMLFQLLLVDRAGWNLRNKVAHTLIRDSQGYGLAYILLLVVVVLKLAKNEYAPPTYPQQV